MGLGAALATAAVGIGGSIISSNATSRAANRAAQAQTDANNAAMAQQQRQYDQTRQDLMPWMTAGQGALGQQGDLLGLNGPDKQAAAIAAQRNSPLYQSLFGNGQNTLLANASATGGLRGGDTQGALANFGRDTLAQVIESQLNNLGGVSQQGQNAAAQVGNFGANMANNNSALLQATGKAQADAANKVGAANATLIGDASKQITGLVNNSGVQQWVGKLL